MSKCSSDAMVLSSSSFPIPFFVVLRTTRGRRRRGTRSRRASIRARLPRRPFLLVSSFEFAQKRALTKDDDASLLLLLLLLFAVVVVVSQILVRAKEIQPERDETEEDWREEEENARAEKRDAETRVIETLSSCSSIEIPNGRMSCVTNVKAQSNT